MKAYNMKFIVVRFKMLRVDIPDVDAVMPHFRKSHRRIYEGYRQNGSCNNCVVIYSDYVSIIFIFLFF
jgi:hypothetical protein